MRRATALPVVLFALSLTSALVVGGSFVARRLVRSQHVVGRSAALEPAVERVLADAITQWDSTARVLQPVGMVAVPHVVGASSYEASVWITRIGERTYWLVAEARDETPPALRRRLGVVVWVSGGVPTLVPERAWSELP